MQNLPTGAKPDKLDIKDFRMELEPTFGSVDLPDEFSLKDKISRVEDQGTSSSCVGQSFSYYAEVLNRIETNNAIELSSRDIYSKIFTDSGGAHLRDGAKKITKSGVILENHAPSYLDGNPPSEAFMRQRNDITEDEIEKGNTYLAKSYVRVPQNSFQATKEAIKKNYGCVLGVWGNNKEWKDVENGIVEPPYKRDWGHAIYCIGWKKTNGREYIEFVNSWGEDWGDNGFGYIPREYFEGRDTFNPWTLTDYPNDYYDMLKKQAGLLKKLLALYKKLIELKG